tara:strand:+ start:696 stop:1142 length:447 start_codon:yes stop_codon:yes gene_type:complete
MKVDFKLNRGTMPELLDKIRKVVLSGKTYRITISEWSAKRGLSANAVQHVFYTKISQFQGVDIKEAGNMSKLDFGLPILLADLDMGPKIDFMLRPMGFFNFPREKQINVMDIFPVTSLFTTKQHNLYRDNLIMHWHQNGLELKYRDES